MILKLVEKNKNYKNYKNYLNKNIYIYIFFIIFNNNIIF